jgi:hypothetical protein
MTDPIDDLLRPSAPALDDPLRPALLLQTTRLLRRRRRLKRLAFVAVMAACYAAGVMTMRFWMAAGGAEKQIAEKPLQETPRTPNRVKKLPKKEKQGVPSPGGQESALALEWRAIDNPKNRFQLYRRAGDLYLQDNDVPSALRCYRGALEAAPARARIFSAQDNWLFMIAKQERQKEQTHVQKGG